MTKEVNKPADIKTSRGSNGDTPSGKTFQSPKEIEITIDNTFDEVLRYDAEGARIFFACEKGRFLALSEAQVEKLSSWTRRVYSVMKAQNAILEAEDPEIVEINRRLTVDQIAGSAQQKLDVRFKEQKRAEEFEIYHFRPDNVATAEAKGWVPVKASEVKTLLPNSSSVGVRHNGVDELVAFKRPKRIREEIAKRRAEEAAARERGEASQYANAVASVGGKPLSERETHTSGWKDIE